MLPRLPRRFERAVRQPPQPLSGRRARSHPGDVVPEAFHERRGFVVVRVFERDGVWDQLQAGQGCPRLAPHIEIWSWGFFVVKKRKTTRVRA